MDSDLFKHALMPEHLRAVLGVPSEKASAGGVASPTDKLENSQYSDDEIRSSIDEATRAGSYVAAHCHPSDAIRRSVVLGVRSIEHTTLIDEEVAGLVAEHEAFTVPTMAIIFGAS